MQIMPYYECRECEDEVMSMADTEYDEEMEDAKELNAVDVNTSTPYPYAMLASRTHCLNWIPLNAKTRQGSEIWMDYIQISPFSVDMDQHKNYVVAIVYDRQPNVEIVRSLGDGDHPPSDLGWPNPATFPTWREVFDVETYTDIINGPYPYRTGYMANRRNQDRFEILYYKHFMGYQAWYNIAPTQMMEPCLAYQKIAVNRPTVYQDIKNIYDPPENFVYGRITTGALYMYVMSSSTTGYDQTSWTRLFYEDA